MAFDGIAETNFIILILLEVPFEHKLEPRLQLELELKLKLRINLKVKLKFHLQPNLYFP